MVADPLEFLNALRDVVLVHNYNMTYCPRLINQEDGSNINLIIHNVEEGSASVVDFTLSFLFLQGGQLTYTVKRHEVSYQNTIESIFDNVIVHNRYQIQMTEIEIE